MKAVIVTPFDNYSYEVRIKYIEKYLKELGYECTIISSDFDHRNKKKYNNSRENLTLIHVPGYKKNLSFSRIYSHYYFSKKVYEKLKEIKPDFIYGSIPPNFLVKYISKYKRKNRNVKLYYEVGDLWPETLPISEKLKKICSPILGIWSKLRNKNIGYADGVIYECDLFKNLISKYHPKTKSKTIYLCKKDYFDNYQIEPTNSTDIDFAYIGSINNIIDIDLIVNFLDKLNANKNVKLHIIGDGENKEKLVSLCKLKKINCIDYGIVYDNAKKYEILKNCSFGFNIMKNSVVVGATMKSLEYFHWGLALINNISGDTKELVEKEKCGFNINSNNIDEIVEKLLQCDIIDMKKNSRNVYEKLFSEKSLGDKFLEFWN